MSNDGLTEENIDLSHIHLAVIVKNLQRDANGHTDYNVIGKWYTSLQMDEEDVIWSLDHVWPVAASAGLDDPGGSQASLDETTSGVATLTSTAKSNLFADQDTSGNNYCISSKSFHGNYSFLNLEIVANSKCCHNISIFYLIN